MSLSITNRTSDDLYLAIERDPEPRLIDDVGGLMHFDKLSGLETTNYPDEDDRTQVSKSGSTIIIITVASYKPVKGSVFSFSSTFFVQEEGREGWSRVSVGLADLRPTATED